MSADKTDLISWNDDEINALTTAQLRAAVDAYLSEYARYRVVATIDLTDDVISTPGALTAFDKLIEVLLKAHRDHEPTVRKRYGDSVELRVRPADDQLRSSLRFERRQAIERAAEQAKQED